MRSEIFPEQIQLSFVYHPMKLLILGVLVMALLVFGGGACIADSDSSWRWRQEARQQVQEAHQQVMEAREQAREVRELAREHARELREDMRAQREAIREQRRQIREQMRELRRDWRNSY
jgi:membrane protein involved in colicin uptake